MAEGCRRTDTGMGRNTGEVKSPDGQYIEHTGVYSEITYFVEGFMGTDMEAHKGKLVDVVRENNKEREDEITEAE